MIMDTKRLLLEQFSEYPKMQIEDVFKFLYQSSFGCEHLVSDYDRALGYIKQEYSCMDKSLGLKHDIEPLDGPYCRVSLSVLSKGVEPESLAMLFMQSAQHVPDGVYLLEKKLEVFKTMVSDGLVPFSVSAVDDAISWWKSKGYPAIHHSEVFRTEYSPAYRVVSKEYCKSIAEITKMREKATSS